MKTIEGFDFFPLAFDEKGKLQFPQEFGAFVERAKSAPATDALFIAHGFRNDVGDATRLYTDFLKTFRGHLSRAEFRDVASRRFVVAGVYWPSKAFRESYDDEASGARSRELRDPSEELIEAREQIDELKKDATPAQRRSLDKAARLLPKLEGSRKAQDEFVAAVLSVVSRSKTVDRTEGLPQIRKQRGSELLARLEPQGDERARGLGNVFGSIAGRVGHFLNLTTWYVMKERSGTVGSQGVAKAVRDLRTRVPKIRIHLVGHSLGGRLMAACANALCDAPKLQPDSLMLLEAAFSHYGFSPDNGRGSAGFFRDVVRKQIVKGPLVSTFSAEDTVVGHAYAISSRLAGDNTRAIGDAADEFGGIGRNGPQRTEEVATSALHAPGKAYDYARGVINNLDGSGGLIKDHGDVTNEAVTYAFASAVART